MKYCLGIDIGSTTVKIVLINEYKEIKYKSYKRHFSKITDVVLEELNRIYEIFSDIEIFTAVTGSGGMKLSQLISVPFVQEVFATSAFVNTFHPDVDVAIELGGEDAKIIFFGANTEEKMNGTCAGGTGAFIDQMAALLNLSAQEMDRLSLNADSVYPIASRCGVFAKSDIQPLLNQGASKQNIAASVYSAVADQTISGLAGGHPIEGNVLFLGGPLTFCQGLRKAFIKALPNINPVFPEDSEYFVVFGASFYASKNSPKTTLKRLIALTEQAKKEALTNIITDNESNPPLFESKKDYLQFTKRHNSDDVKYKSNISDNDIIYIGIDAGSTTTKTVAINQDNEILFTDYSSNFGDPIESVRKQLISFYEKFPDAEIGSVYVTGYGEDLIINAFHADSGMVETMAHYTAARYFRSDVDFIIDIGGQDMKCFKIHNGAISKLVLNEACSSGCGSFLQSFAESMGYTAQQFAQLALFAEHPVDLGSRCTVFMNSSVKQSQRNGADIKDIAAGLAVSVVKNALFKVLRVRDPKSLGERIVVQGGTFKNDAVLRAFEQLLGTEVIRPSISGLMGAFGAALAACKTKQKKSSLISKQQLETFTCRSVHTRCKLCQNHCTLTISHFPDGTRYISGNRCSAPTGKAADTDYPDLYHFKQQYLEKFFNLKSEGGKTIGIPLVLNFYDALPFWATLLHELGFSVNVSGFSDRNIYRTGQHTIPSDTVCYGAKLVHGHIIKLINEKVDAVFYPRASYNFSESNSDNHFNCPIVAYYPEVIAANVNQVKSALFLNDFIDLNHEKNLAKQLLKMLSPLDSGLHIKKIQNALKTAAVAQTVYRNQVEDYGKYAYEYAQNNNLKTVILAGRPYHIDPELNHGINKMISSLGFVILSEDSIPMQTQPYDTAVLNQWTYHNRMYNAAYAAANMKDTELIQLISFGCGLDAVTSDEIKDILEKNSKLYTGIKIDEINNLGAAKIRVRSLLAAMQERKLSENEK